MLFRSQRAFGRGCGSLFQGGRVDIPLVLLLLEVILFRALTRMGIFVVVGDDVSVGWGRPVEPGVLFPEQGAKGNVAGAETGIALDQTAVEVGHEEGVGNGQAPKEDSKDDAAELAHAEFLKGRARGDLDDDEEGEDGGREGQIEGDHAQTPFERIGAVVDRVLDRAEDHGREGGGDERCDPPGGGNLRDGAILPGPFDGGLGGVADPDERADDGLGGGHGEAIHGCDDEPDGAADLGAAHAQDEGARRGLEAVDVDDAVLDGLGDAGAEGDGADELGTHGEEADLRHGEGASGDGGGIGIGDIVGAVTKGAGAEGDGDDREDPVVLGEDGHGGVLSVLSLSLSRGV